MCGQNQCFLGFLECSIAFRRPLDSFCERALARAHPRGSIIKRRNELGRIRDKTMVKVFHANELHELLQHDWPWEIPDGLDVSPLQA